MQDTALKKNIIYMLTVSCMQTMHSEKKATRKKENKPHFFIEKTYSKENGCTKINKSAIRNKELIKRVE